jgi:hypothetical protein
LNWFLKRLPGQHLELLISTLVMLGLMGIMWAVRQQDIATNMTLVSLEIALPLMTGILAAGSFAGDPALDILLSVPRPAYLTLTERLLIILSQCAVLGVSIQILAHQWNIALPIDGIKRFLIWIPPVIFISGLGSTASLIRGRVMDGLVTTISVWMLAIFSTPWILMYCQGDPQRDHCYASLASPLMTMVYPVDPEWTINRLVWLGLGIGLITLSLILSRREEHLVLGSKGERE